MNQTTNETSWTLPSSEAVPSSATRASSVSIGESRERAKNVETDFVERSLNGLDVSKDTAMNITDTSSRVGGGGAEVGVGLTNIAVGSLAQDAPSTSSFSLPPPVKWTGRSAKEMLSSPFGRLSSSPPHPPTKPTFLYSNITVTGPSITQTYTVMCTQHANTVGTKTKAKHGIKAFLGLYEQLLFEFPGERCDDEGGALVVDTLVRID